MCLGLLLTCGRWIAWTSKANRMQMFIQRQLSESYHGSELSLGLKLSVIQSKLQSLSLFCCRGGLLRSDWSIRLRTGIGCNFPL